MLFSVLTVGAVIAVIAALIAVAIYQTKEIRAARKQYKQCLSLLARDPANPQLRSMTLTMGQIYVGLVNDGRGRSRLNEWQIMRDIEAACARAPMVSTAPPIDPTLDPESPEARLTILNHSLSQGLITGQEYIVKREQLVGKG